MTAIHPDEIHISIHVLEVFFILILFISQIRREF